MLDKDRAIGALIGMAVGDALGTTLEFKHLPEAPWSPLLSGPHTEVIGAGPFGLVAGQVTDDTQMACCLAASLAEFDALDLDDVASRYSTWRGAAFDVGVQTGGSLFQFDRGAPSYLAGKHCWMTRKNAAGNGSLMRTTPIGVYFNGDPETVIEASLYDSSITHFDPRCMLACAAHNAAVALAVSDSKATPREMLAAADDSVVVACDMFVRDHDPEGKFTKEMDAAQTAMYGDTYAANQADPCLYSSELHLQSMQGFVRVGFTLAFWELLHAPTFEAGLIDCVNRGGDSDTNGAIAGGLLGAFHGLKGIPKRWVDVVMGANPRKPFQRGGAYHPEVLFKLLDVL